MPDVRLFLDQPLGEGKAVRPSPDQCAYLFAVMRLREGDGLRVFDGRAGEWAATVLEAGRRGGALLVGRRLRPLLLPPDLWLLFAPLRKARTDFVVEKAAEMGASRILPVLTERTGAERVNRLRLQAHAVEAAEQCEATHVAEVAEARRLGEVLRDWDGRPLWVCDEALARGPAGAPPAGEEGPGAVLVGPEGGFTPEEREGLHRLPFARALRLGPRILRADTAAVAALALWQAWRGDWR